MLQLVDTESAPSADPRSFTADTLILAARLGVLEDILPRPVRCWGIMHGNGCPCPEHQAMRDAKTLHGVDVSRPARQPWEVEAA